MLYEQGRRREDVYEMIVLNVRHPRDFRGDLAAMIGSARIGERRLGQLLAEFGSATTHAAVAAVLDGAERQVRPSVPEAIPRRTEQELRYDYAQHAPRGAGRRAGAAFARGL
jgi:N-methylhydantoinase B/oxoprolinase/acetone carboxylase alpha subunit